MRGLVRRTHARHANVTRPDRAFTPVRTCDWPIFSASAEPSLAGLPAATRLGGACAIAPVTLSRTAGPAGGCGSCFRARFVNSFSNSGAKITTFPRPISSSVRTAPAALQLHQPAHVIGSNPGRGSLCCLFEKAPMRTRQPSGAPAGRLPSVSRSPGSRPLVSPVTPPTPVLAGAVVLPARPHGDQAVASARAGDRFRCSGSSLSDHLTSRVLSQRLLGSAPVSLGRAHQRLVPRRSAVGGNFL